MKKETTENITHVKSSRKEMVYTDEFKEKLGLTKEAFRKFLELAEKIDPEKDIDKKFGSEKFGVTLIKPGHKFAESKLEWGIRHYRVDMNSKSYFVKKIPKWKSFYGGGVQEALSQAKIAKLLQQENIDWVEIVPFEFAYSDNKNRYFVTRWDDRLTKTLRYHWLHQEKSKLSNEELGTMEKRLQKLQEVLQDKFADVRDHNMSYDPDSKKIIIFDIK